MICRLTRKTSVDSKRWGGLGKIDEGNGHSEIYRVRSHHRKS